MESLHAGRRSTPALRGCRRQLKYAANMVAGDRRVDLDHRPPALESSCALVFFDALRVPVGLSPPLLRVLHRRGPVRSRVPLERVMHHDEMGPDRRRGRGDPVFRSNAPEVNSDRNQPVRTGFRGRSYCPGAVRSAGTSLPTFARARDADRPAGTRCRARTVPGGDARRLCDVRSGARFQGRTGTRAEPSGRWVRVR
jgi:hypothetical protein